MCRGCAIELSAFGDSERHQPFPRFDLHIKGPSSCRLSPVLLLLALAPSVSDCVPDPCPRVLIPLPLHPALCHRAASRLVPAASWPSSSLDLSTTVLVSAEPCCAIPSPLPMAGLHKVVFRW